MPGPIAEQIEDLQAVVRSAQTFLDAMRPEANEAPVLAVAGWMRDCLLGLIMKHGLTGDEATALGARFSTEMDAQIARVERKLTLV